MECQTALEILECTGFATPPLASEDIAAAEAHLAGCRRCTVILQSRQRFDRKIARAMRAVAVPEAAQERLLDRIAELEFPQRDSHYSGLNGTKPLPPNGAARHTSDELVVEETMPVPLSLQAAGAPLARALPDERVPVNGPTEEEFAEVAGEKTSVQWFSRSRIVSRRLLLAAACLTIAGLGLLGGRWLLRPAWTVDDVRAELARVEFERLDDLPEFNGDQLANTIPAEPGWQKLEWRFARTPKGLPATARRHVIAVFSFLMPNRERHVMVEGLLAVIPRNRVRTPPVAGSFAESLSDASASRYNSGPSGETVSVAWTSGDVVCVCLVGTDSLSLLQRLVDEPPA